MECNNFFKFAPKIVQSVLNSLIEFWIFEVKGLETDRNREHPGCFVFHFSS